MKINLLEALAQVPDFRAPRGRRYPLRLVLLLVIMGTLSNCLGYQALEDFACRHHAALVERLKLPSMRFPSDSTFRRVMMGIDFTQLAQVFTDWTRDWMPSQENTQCRLVLTSALNAEAIASRLEQCLFLTT